MHTNRTRKLAFSFGRAKNRDCATIFTLGEATEEKSKNILWASSIGRIIQEIALATLIIRMNLFGQRLDRPFLSRKRPTNDESALVDRPEAKKRKQAWLAWERLARFGRLSDDLYDIWCRSIGRESREKGADNHKSGQKAARVISMTIITECTRLRRSRFFPLSHGPAKTQTSDWVRPLLRPSP